ncbi:MAG TPA: response regulator [Solirubrobacteraceae bacterium]|jgi:chemotaxis protein histidine kinase CheA/ActR/RegA family two-component response regulator|nr:response regulator [Solirubrobacteraceae bacterium]
MTAAEVTPDLIQIFREEAAEHLDGIVSCLIAVEAGQTSGEATDALFRHAHSIKGSAGMVGLQEAGAIANAIEDVLQRARETGALSPLLTEPLLHATDALRRAIAGERGIAPAAVKALAAEAPENGTSADNGTLSESGTAEHQAVEHHEVAVDTSQDIARPRSIRVAAHKVDRMLDAVSETVLHHRRLEHMLDGATRRPDEAIEQEVGSGERLLDELQETVLELRMVPLSSITSSLPRAVRDLAAAEGKQVDLEITGAETQLDRVLLDGMSEAINHLLRNAVAHGIELPDVREHACKPRRGALKLHAEPRGGQVAIEVRDDGGGVAAAALAEGARRGSLVDVLAEAGFTTAEGVSEIAGRGVGLDAVKRQVESVGGSLAIDTEPGRGTSTTLLLPATLALLRVLVVERGGQRFGLPLASVTEVIAVEQVMMLGGRPSILVGEESLPLSDLAPIIGMVAPDLPEISRALVVDATNGRLAVACEEAIVEQEVVVKPLGRSLAGVSGYLGAAILGDGAVVLVLDPAYLVRQAPRASAAIHVGAAAALMARQAPKVLVVDDQFTVRELQRSILRTAGYRVEVACDGREALDALGATGDFDIVVTDLQMPEMDGLALLGAIRADPDRSSLPVIVVTSRGSDEDRKRGAQAGADAYIVKDEFDQQALLEAVKRLVGAR